MGNAITLLSESIAKKEQLLGFQLLGAIKVGEARQYFSSKFDYHHHLLSRSEFDDVFLSWFGVKSHSFFDIFGTNVVSSFEFLVLGFLLSSNKKISFSERLSAAMAFFQFSIDTNDDMNNASQVQKFVRKDEVMLLLETAVVAMCRLSSTNILGQHYAVSIIDNIFGGLTQKPWNEVQVLLTMNHEVIEFTKHFTEILNWPSITKSFNECMEHIDKSFLTCLLVTKSKILEDIKEECKVFIAPPSSIKPSRSRIVKMKEIANTSNQTSKDKRRNSQTFLDGNCLKIDQCVNLLVKLMSSKVSMQSLEKSEIKALRFILEASSNGEWVKKEIFDRVCKSLTAFSLIDSHHRNKIYPAHFIELRDLSIGDFTEIFVIEDDTDYDIDSDLIKAPSKIVMKHPSKMIERDGLLVIKDTCSVIIAKVELQLAVNIECPRKGYDLYGEENILYVTRIGWVEFNCDLFRKIGVDIFLLNSFQRLDDENKGALNDKQLGILVRERFVRVIFLSGMDMKNVELSEESESLIESNLIYVITSFVDRTISVEGGLSRWDDIQSNSKVGYLILHTKFLSSFDS